MGVATLCAALVACASVEPPGAQPPDVRPAPTLVPSAAPVAAAQVFAEDEVEYVFTDPDRRKKLESAFPALDEIAEAALRETKAPGLMLGVVIDGELAYAKGFGYADIEKQTRPDIDTIYPLASTSKSFTSLAMLALRDDGVLTLEDPITRWIPEASGLVYPTRDAPPITLRQMLTHTSGLPRIGSYERGRYEHPVAERELIGSLAGVTLDAAPGTQFGYSNFAFGLLGLGIGRASHSSLETFVGKRILGPLGMKSTAYDPESLSAAHRATCYRKNASGGFEAVTVRSSGALAGAGGLFSTTRDMARYLAFQMAAYPPRSGPDTGPIRRSTLREAHLDHGKGFPIEVKRGEPAGDKLVTVSTANYGFGWIDSESCDFERVVWHNGGDVGSYNWVGFLPERGVGVMTFTNHMGGPYINTKVLQALERSGGLSRRVPRMKRLSPALEGVMPKFLAVLNAWDEAAYKAMLTTPRFEPLEEEKEELAGYRKTHGACKGYTPIKISSLTTATFEMQCERARLEMEILINQSDGLIKGFAGVSRDVSPPPALAEAAARLAGLIGKWDETVYKKYLGPKTRTPRADTEALFARLRTTRASCKVKSFWRWANQPRFALSCDHGEDLELTVALDDKSPDLITSYSITTGPPEVCPSK